MARELRQSKKDRKKKKGGREELRAACRGAGAGKKGRSFAPSATEMEEKRKGTRWMPKLDRRLGGEGKGGTRTMVRVIH